MAAPKNQQAIRVALRQSDDGMTIKEISEATLLDIYCVLKVLKAMPDVYIDRWHKGRNGRRYSAVWAAAEVPENTPYPTDKNAPGRFDQGHELGSSSFT